MTINVPDGVNVHIEGSRVTVKGPAGEVDKVFNRMLTFRIEGRQLLLSTDSSVFATNKNKSLTRTTEVVLSNMIIGAKNGYKRYLKLLYAHFPISIEIKGKDVAIKNFLGEKQQRKTVLVGNTKIEAKGQNVTVHGPDKEAVGQTIANLRTAMKIKGKDPRVFQDGLYDSEEV